MEHIVIPTYQESFLQWPTDIITIFFQAQDDLQAHQGK